MAPAPRPAIAQFDTRGVEISEEQLSAMIAALHDADDPAGRRSALRVPVEGFAFLARGGEKSGAAQRIGIYDMSRTGVAVVDAEAMAPGEKFNILFPRPDRRPIEVLCTARHCRAHGDGFTIGAEFGVSWLSAVADAIAPNNRLSSHSPSSSSSPASTPSPPSLFSSST
jgi:hypothetical protein